MKGIVYFILILTFLCLGTEELSAVEGEGQSSTDEGQSSSVEGQSFKVNGSLGLESKWAMGLDPLALVFEGEERFSQGKMEFSLKHRIDGRVDQSASINLLVYEAYALLRPWDGGDFFIGKRRMVLGLGSSFTPGDTFNPMVGLFDQKSGALSMQGALSFNSDIGMVLGVSADRIYSHQDPQAELLDYGAVFNGLFDKVQVQGALVYGYNKTFLPSLGITYDLGGVILTVEGCAEFLPRNIYPSGTAYQFLEEWVNPKFSGITGLRYTYTGDPIVFTISQEYFFNGQGWTEDELDFWSGLPVMVPRPPLPRPLRSQHYLVSKFSFGWDQYFNCNFGAYGSLTEGSWLFQQGVSWTWSDNLEISGSLLLARGPASSEWEYLPGIPGLKNQFTAAVKVHF